MAGGTDVGPKGHSVGHCQAAFRHHRRSTKLIWLRITSIVVICSWGAFVSRILVVAIVTVASCAAAIAQSRHPTTECVNRVSPSNSHSEDADQFGLRGKRSGNAPARCLAPAPTDD